MELKRNFNIKKICFIGLIMIITVVSRMIGIEKYPVGIHADEAYAGYEAYSMLNYGIDSWGYHHPVYLTVWGSGMSILESCMMMPFIKIGGLNLYMIRLPQAIMGVLSVFILYLLIKKICNQQMAYWAGFLVAVCPWHIMMSRWGLDANLAPAFILLGMYFSVLGLEKEKYLIIAALFWGLSLYSYALTWIFVPAFLVLSFLYCRKYQKIRAAKYFWVSAAVLGLIALPLLLFVAVNQGILPEIKTQYLSIPKLVEFRSDELTFSISNIRDLLRIYIKQNDYSLMNTIPFFGLYYLFSLPVIVLGGWVCLTGAVSNMKNRKFGYEAFLVFWIILCTMIGVMRSMNAYRANIMNLAVLILEVMGIYWLCQRLHKEWFKKGLVLLYICSFGFFELYYFTAYQDDIKDIQRAGLEPALEYALDIQKDEKVDKICISDRIPHPQILFYTKYPADAFLDTVSWKNYPAKWVYAKKFGCFEWDEGEMDGDICLISIDDIADYENAGYHTEQFDAYAVAYR